MSYILSALRKAEAERRDGGGNSTDNSAARAFTVVADREPALPATRRKASWLIMAVVVAASTAGFYSFWGRQDSRAIVVAPYAGPASQAPEAGGSQDEGVEAQAQNAQGNEAAVPETTVPEMTVPETSASEATAPKATAPKATAPKATAPKATAPKATAPQTTAIASTAPEAPGNDAPLPAINVTGYIFFEDNPANSKLFVDGIVYRQHSRIDDGLTIEEFHRDHVLLRYRGSYRQLRIH